MDQVQSERRAGVDAADSTREAQRSTHERQARRQQFADALNAEVEHCRTLFPDGIAFGKWRIVDRSEKVADRIIYCCRRRGQAGWQPQHDLSDERLADGRFRFEVRFTAIEEYHPLTVEVLEKRNKTRKENARKRKLQQEREHLPLFVDQLEEP